MSLAKLTAALKACTGGETIDATGWDIEAGRPRLPDFRANPVTIKGGTWRGIYNAMSGLILDGARIEVTAAKGFPFRVSKSTNFHIRNSLITADPAVPIELHESAAVYLDGCTDSSITDCEVTHCRYGIQISRGTGITIARNHFHDMRTDAIRGDGYDGLLIEDNRMHSWRVVEGDHPDGIQFWPVLGFPSRNAVLRRNVMLREDGAIFQGILMQTKPDGQGGVLAHEYLTIEDNIILGGMQHGLFAEGSSGVVRRNVVAGFLGQRSWINAQGFSGPVEGNTATWFLGPKNGVLAGNTKVREDMPAAEVMAAYAPKPRCPTCGQAISA